MSHCDAVFCCLWLNISNVKVFGSRVETVAQVHSSDVIQVGRISLLLFVTTHDYHEALCVKR